MQEVIKVNDELVIDYKCRGYCKLPYHGHKNGCPNFNVHDDCPPKVGLVKDIFNLNKDLYFIIEEFNLKNHIEQMKIKHSNWSLLQLKNLLYWQNGVRKRLKEKIHRFIRTKDCNMIYTLLPEAMGVMVIDTALKLGVPIEKRPENRIFKIALVGYPINKTKNSIQSIEDIYKKINEE